MACREESKHDPCGEAHNHDHDHDHDHDHEDSSGDSLYQFIDTVNVRCLNANNPEDAAKPFKEYFHRKSKEEFLESNDDDPDLILYIPFTQSVNIKSICISGGPDGNHPQYAKLFTNRDDIDFSTAQELPCLQQLELTEDFNVEIDYPLQIRKFQGVSSLTIYFSENMGGDRCRLYYIGLKGENKGWKHGIVHTVYESQAQRSDHHISDSMSHRILEE